MIVEPAPIGWIFFSRLNPNTAGIVSTSIITRFTIRDFFLLQSHSSTDIVIMFSNTAITVERAANDMKMKKNIPHKRLEAIWWKTLGRVMKSSDGPESGSMPYAKQAGIMISPATTATAVSRTITFTDSPTRVRSFFK